MNPRIHEVGRLELRRLEEDKTFKAEERASENQNKLEVSLIGKEAVERSGTCMCLHGEVARGDEAGLEQHKERERCVDEHSSVPILLRQLVPHEQRYQAYCTLSMSVNLTAAPTRAASPPALC